MPVLKKFVVGALMAGMLMPALAFAQTASSTSALIQQLQQQIVALKAQIALLTQARTQVSETQKNVRETARLIRQLDEGHTGEDVKILQAVLAAEGLLEGGDITGFFGKKTASSLRKLQKKFGIDQAGRVGKKTLERLNKFLREHPVIVVANASGQQTLCAVALPGFAVPSGWLKKLSNGNQVIPICDSVPQPILDLFGLSSTTPGIGQPCLTPQGQLTARGFLKKFDDDDDDDEDDDYDDKKFRGRDHSTLPRCADPTTPPVADTTAPAISRASVSSITSNGATVSWNTSENATGKVYYSAESPINLLTALTASSTSLVTRHSFGLTGLTASTTYNYVLESKDAANNSAVTVSNSFTTE